MSLDEFIDWTQSSHIDIRHYLPEMQAVASSFETPTIVEIGVGRGGSTVYLLKAAIGTKGHLYSLDIDANPGGPGYNSPWSPMAKRSEWHVEEYWDFIVGDSLETVKTWDKPIQFLFIDGKHTYEQAKGELEKWSNWVVPGGFIVMHDVCTEEWAGVRRAMDEFLLDPFCLFHIDHINGSWPGIAYLKRVLRPEG